MPHSLLQPGKALMAKSIQTGFFGRNISQTMLDYEFATVSQNIKSTSKTILNDVQLTFYWFVVVEHCQWGYSIF